MDNHHHCLICGDVIDPSKRICLKEFCQQKYYKKEVRYQKSGNNYIFKPGNCVETCKGHKMYPNETGMPDDENIIECWQIGKEPHNMFR